MINRLPCSNCGQLIDINEARCPFCDLELMDTPDNEANIPVLDFNNKTPRKADTTPGLTHDLLDGCLRIAQADSLDDVYMLANDVLKVSPHTSAILLNDPIGMHVYAVNRLPSTEDGLANNDLVPHERLAFTAGELEGYFTPSHPVLFVNLDYPSDTYPSNAPPIMKKTLTRLGCVSYVLLSVLVEGKLSALIILGSGQNHYFNPANAGPYVNLVGFISTTIRKTRLLREAKMHTERERVVAELTNKLWASTNVDTILRTALNELGRSMNASRGYIQLDISEQSQMLNIGDD